MTRKDIVRNVLYEHMGGRCAYCGEELKKDWHIEHKRPRSRQGRRIPNNRVASCPECNCMKGEKTVSEYREYVQEEIASLKIVDVLKVRGSWFDSGHFLFYMDIKKIESKRERYEALADAGLSYKRILGLLNATKDFRGSIRAVTKETEIIEALGKSPLGHEGAKSFWKGWSASPILDLYVAQDTLEHLFRQDLLKKSHQEIKRVLMERGREDIVTL